MKKGLIITLIVLVILVLISVAIFIMLNKNIFNEGKSDITMIIKEGTLTKTSATVIIKDNDKEHSYGEGYRIEKKENGEWKTVKQIGTYSFNLIALGTVTGELDFKLDWSERYGELENGEYRIVKTLDTEGGKLELYAEFTIE